jgi:predicted O-methyltransferase YrrM
MSSGGSLITLEASEKHADIARTNIARADLAGVVEVRVGPALETLPRLAAEARSPFDLIFIDADKEGYAEYFAWALKLARLGSMIIADNVIRDGEILDPANSDPRVQGMRRFNQLLANEPRVKATVIQTVGRKGHDGMAIAIVIAQ